MDALACLAAGWIAHLVRFGLGDATLVQGQVHISYAVLGLALVPFWLAAMAINGAYDRRLLGNGSDEYRRVFDGALRVLAVLAIGAFLFQLGLARAYVGVLCPAAAAFTLLGRHAARKVVHHRRARGAMNHKVVVVGAAQPAADLVRHLRGAPYAGFSVLGACVAGDAEKLDVDGEPVVVLGDPLDIERVLFETGADAVAVAGAADLPGGSLRALGWRLEGTGVDLIVAPNLTDVAGPRIVHRPVAGLPLLQVEEPELSGGARLFKDVVDRATAALIMLIGAPFFLAVTVAVRVTSRGAAIFRQTRVGRDGKEFTIYKFRTMRRSAESERPAMVRQNDHGQDGVLFKMRHDPRCTRVGRWLRRLSIDELPQMWNVLRGEMSIVGPRPPLPSEVALYADHVRRRLLVKPGLTGLWQVSGRSDLTWDETVRLDLYYIENWSPAMDASILWKTMRAVLQGRGAY
jgi:exopolysaccharide biosynthesis polyprenyl glycosylphosphotransferase